MTYPRPIKQSPFSARFRRRSRAPWRTVLWVEHERYFVDGGLATAGDPPYEDPVLAIRAAEKFRLIARRVSDGAPLNYYAEFQEDP